MPFYDAELNYLADYGTASAMTVRAHTSAPGTSGTTGRVGSAQSLAAASWSAAASGSSTYNAAVAFGVIDASNEQVLTHISVYRGSALVGWKALEANVTVPANATFTLETGTLDYTLTTPAS